MMRETGSVETRVSLRGRKPALSQTDIQDIDRMIQTQPDITIHEIREELQLQVSDETVRKAWEAGGILGITFFFAPFAGGIQHFEDTCFPHTVFTNQNVNSIA